MKELTLKEMFYNSDRRVEKHFTDPTKKDLYLFWKLAELVPTNWTDVDGNVIPMDFINKFVDPVDYGFWRILEREYFHNYSKNKLTSVILDEIAEEEDWFDPEKTAYKVEVANLAADIWRLYGENWCRLWYAIQEKYRPLDNFNGSEKTVSNGYERKVVSDAWNTMKQDKTETDISNGVYGFNSSSSVPASTGHYTTTPSNTIDADNAGIPDNQNTINEASNTVRESQTGNLENIKHGNLGITTSQQMLASEYDFRRDYNFYKRMFDDIDNVLTCHTYGGEC